MTGNGFDAIDSLLSSVTEQATLPEAAVRRALREHAHLSKAQVAKAFGVSPSTLSGWESGRDPSGEVRTKYAYLLDGLAAKFTPQVPAAEADDDQADADPAPEAAPEDDELADDVEVLAVPEPCVLCGSPAGHRIDGFAQHLDPTDCQTTPTPPAPVPAPAEPAADAGTAPARTTPAPKSAPPAPARTARTSRPAARPTAQKKPRGRVFQEESGPGDLIVQAVQAALTEAGGDVRYTHRMSLSHAVAVG